MLEQVIINIFNINIIIIIAIVIINIAKVLCCQCFEGHLQFQDSALQRAELMQDEQCALAQENKKVFLDM